MWMGQARRRLLAFPRSIPPRRFADRLLPPRPMRAIGTATCLGPQNGKALARLLPLARGCSMIGPHLGLRRIPAGHRPVRAGIPPSGPSHLAWAVGIA
jgi:hypothetical protein